jgi:hypothetical protein
MKNKIISLLVLITLVGVTPASAATKKFTSTPTSISIGTATFSSYGQGYSDVITTQNGTLKDAFAFKFRLLGGTEEIEAFCIQPSEPFNTTQGLPFTPWKPSIDIFSLTNYQKAADIAKNHRLMGVVLTDPSATTPNALENVAAQLAIWKLVDSEQFDLNKIASSDVKQQLISRVNYLVSNANSDKVKISDSTVTIKTKVEKNVLYVTMSSSDSSKVANLPLSISYKDGSSALAVTNSKGVARFTKLVKGTTKITGTVQIGAGSIYTAPRSQAVIMTVDTPVTFTSKLLIK